MLVNSNCFTVFQFPTADTTARAFCAITAANFPILRGFVSF